MKKLEESTEPPQTLDREPMITDAYKRVFTLFQFLSSRKCPRAVLNSTLMVTTQLVPTLKPPYMLIEAK